MNLINPLPGHVGFLLRRGQQMHVAAWQDLVSGEVSSVQYGVLSLLRSNPGASQQDLCTALDLDRSTIADVVARLERRGLIERVRDEFDRRRNVMTLSSSGRAQLDVLVPRIAELDRRLTRALDDDEAERLRALLEKMLSG